MLKKIREKPHHIKQSIALGITVLIFSAILFVWISSRDARNTEVEVRAKTVSPLSGVTSMFQGFISNFEEKFSGPRTTRSAGDPVTATSTDNFDISAVVVLDPASGSAHVVSTSTLKTK